MDGLQALSWIVQPLCQRWHNVGHLVLVQSDADMLYCQTTGQMSSTTREIMAFQCAGHLLRKKKSKLMYTSAPLKSSLRSTLLVARWMSLWCTLSSFLYQKTKAANQLWSIGFLSLLNQSSQFRSTPTKVLVTDLSPAENPSGWLLLSPDLGWWLAFSLWGCHFLHDKIIITEPELTSGVLM